MFYIGGLFMTMKKNEHIGALVRIIALEIANGDTAKAEELIAWAYGLDEKKTNIRNEDKNPTDTFIRNYLDPEKGATKSEARLFADTYVQNTGNLVNFNKVAEYIRKMDYKDFLKTTYWKGISIFVKERAGKACELCGATKKLATHHLHYLNHGDEIHHTEDLQCLCKDCHQKTHGIIQDDTEKKRRPLTGSTISLRDILDLD